MSARAPLIVTYHYVRPHNSEGVTGITPEVFDAQLHEIGRRYRFVSAEEFVGVVHGRDARAAGHIAGHSTSRCTKPIALITFDDAVRDQFEHALPVLTRRGVPAVFFAPMRPLDPGLDPLEAWTPQHLLHALAQTLGWRELERRVRTLLGPVTIQESQMHRLYHYEVVEKRWLKYVLAFAIEAERAREVLHAINVGNTGAGRCAGGKQGPRLSAHEWFMTKQQLLEIQARGHALGGHGYDHLPYSTLTPLEQAMDMGRAVGLMNGLFGVRPRTIAFPFGRADEATRTLCQAFGYTHAFTTEDRVDCQFLDALWAKDDRIVTASEDSAREQAA